MKINLIKISIILISIVNLVYMQGDFDLEDLNFNSESYGQFIGPDDYLDDIVIVFFGHEY